VTEYSRQDDAFRHDGVCMCLDVCMYVCACASSVCMCVCVRVCVCVCVWIYVCVTEQSWQDGAFRHDGAITCEDATFCDCVSDDTPSAESSYALPLCREPVSENT